MNEFIEKYNALPYYNRFLIILIALTFIFFVFAALIAFYNSILGAVFATLGGLTILAMLGWLFIIEIVEDR